MTQVDIIQFLLLVPVRVFVTFQYSLFHCFAFWNKLHISFHTNGRGFSWRLKPPKCWLGAWTFGQTFSITLSQTNLKKNVPQT